MTETNITLSPEQQAAAEVVRNAPLGIVTGGAGTGKSTCMQEAIAPLERVVLAAPTGKAAKRLSEVTGKPAGTLHRLLKLIPGEQGPVSLSDGEPPLAGVDCVVVDEASMLDLHLAGALFAAAEESNTRVILVGDHGQLPPVGPGEVFLDLLSRPEVPVASLTMLFRAAAESWMARESQKIREGCMPSLEDTADFRYVETVEDDLLAATLESVFASWDGETFRTQVLSPVKTTSRGAATWYLNHAIQAERNKRLDRPFFPRVKTAEPEPGCRLNLHVGDPVVQTRNNYDLGVFNGEVGRVANVDGGKVTVVYADRDVSYSPFESYELELAYAMTVHKSQGSEWKDVTLVFPKIPNFGSRELLYTAVTRAKGSLTLISEPDAIRTAVNNSVQGRTTRLGARIDDARGAS